MQPICKVAFAHQYNTALMLYYSCCNFEMQVLICDLMPFPLLSGNQKPKLKNNTTIVDVLVSNPITKFMLCSWMHAALCFYCDPVVAVDILLLCRQISILYCYFNAADW